MFSEHLKRSAIPVSGSFDLLIENESRVRERLTSYLVQRSIPYLDVPEPLRNAVGKERIDPVNHDGYPNKNCYRIMTERIRYCLTDHLGEAVRRRQYYWRNRKETLTLQAQTLVRKGIEKRKDACELVPELLKPNIIRWTTETAAEETAPSRERGPVDALTLMRSKSSVN